jgi:3-oxoacyl-[acyl-carrier protein] reductase
MDIELHRVGIRTNALAPVAATDMTSVFEGRDVGHAESFPPPDTVAPIIVFLAGSESDHVHGQVLSFDGTDLAVWSHPRATTTVSGASWESSTFSVALTETVMEHPNPDHWGTGVLGPA